MFNFHSNPYNHFQNPNVFINPNLPYNGTIPGGLQPGKEIHINGHIPHHGHRFEINLRGNHGIALHFNPRFDQNCIVLNTEQRGSWGSEERHALPFHKGQHFQVVIRADHHHYHVSVNGVHAFNYNHRVESLIHFCFCFFEF
jgi:galectin-8